MIAVDAMGGDRAPRAAVLGALRAARQGVSITLYGDESRISSLLDHEYRSWKKLSLSIKHCPAVISMYEQPSRAVVKKKDSSLVCAVQAVADGAADAVVSAGNSGAMLAAGTLLLGRVRGLSRPAIGQFLPTERGSIFCLDLGANADCKPVYLEHFGIIGSTYVQLVRGVERPRVALLSNGEEPYKGSMLVKDAFARLKQSPVLNFVGNLEPRYMFDDHADVLVSDGFTGNVLLKTVEGTGRAVVDWISQEGRSSFLRKLLFLCAAPLLKKLRKKIDYGKTGGALLLGVNKPMVLAHGASDARSMMYAILFTQRMVHDRVVSRFNERLVDQLSKNGNVTRRVAQKVKSIFRPARQSFGKDGADRSKPGE